MFKKFILFFVVLGLTISVYGAWDESGVAGTNTVAANTTATIANNTAIHAVIGTQLDTGTAITSTAAELNALDGITSTVTELNYTDGVTSAIQTQLAALSAEGVKLPSGAVFFMLSGSCPTGTTDVTATYSGRFVKAGTSQGTTAEPTLTGATASHTLTTAQIPAHTHSISTTIAAAQTEGYNYLGYKNSVGSSTKTSNSTGGGGGHTHTLSGATTLEPKSVQMKWCQCD